MGAMTRQITSLIIVYSTVYSDADQIKHQSSASQAFVLGILPETGEFPAQMASNTENVSNWWRYHEVTPTLKMGVFSGKYKYSIFIHVLTINPGCQLLHAYLCLSP